LIIECTRKRLPSDLYYDTVLSIVLALSIAPIRTIMTPEFLIRLRPLSTICLKWATSISGKNPFQSPQSILYGHHKFLAPFHKILDVTIDGDGIHKLFVSIFNLLKDLGSQSNSGLMKGQVAIVNILFIERISVSSLVFESSIERSKRRKIPALLSSKARAAARRRSSSSID
jgi:hypothetical protein